ncbi:MAG: YceI family protein [Pirellulales bacterium]
MRIIAAVALAVLLAGYARSAAAQARDGQVETGSATQGERKAYRPGELYLPGSRVFVHVSKTGLGHEHAVIGGVSQGSLNLGAEDNAGEIVFDMQSFRADTEAARKYLGLSGATSASAQRETTANMLGSSVLNADEFPTAVFKIASARLHPKRSRRDLPQYELQGEFTLHGVTRPLNVLAEAEPVKGWQRVRGSFAINQTDFGIKPFTKAFGAIGVADRLTIWGDVLVAAGAGVARAAAPR